MKRNHSLLSRVCMITLTLTALLYAATPAFALPADARQQAIDEAKEELLNYRVSTTTVTGGTATTELHFNSEEQLNAAAEYLVNNDVEISDLIAEILEQHAADFESSIPSEVAVPITTDYPSVTKEVPNTNGDHYVFGTTAGFTHFDTGSSDPNTFQYYYSIDLSYTITVSGGKFTKISDIEVVVYQPASGSWALKSTPQYITDKNAGVTANYVVYNTLSSELFDIVLSDDEDFAVIAVLQ